MIRKKTHSPPAVLLFNFAPTLLGIAFTSVPDNFDVEKLILVRHQHLFDRGLDETYFDHTVELFVETLQELNVDPELIAEAQAVIRPLRKYFEEGAELARHRKRKAMQQQRMQQVGLAAVLVATAALLATKALRRGKKYSVVAKYAQEQPIGW